MADTSRIEELRRRVQRDPASIAFAQLAEEYRRAGWYQEAIETCEQGLAHHPGYLSARVTLGRSYLETNELDAAQLELRQVLRAAPENLAALRGLAEIHHRRGELQDALAHYRTALEFARNDPELQHLVEQIAKELEPQPAGAMVLDGLSFEDVKNAFLNLSIPETDEPAGDEAPASGAENALADDPDPAPFADGPADDGEAFVRSSPDETAAEVRYQERAAETPDQPAGDVMLEAPRVVDLALQPGEEAAATPLEEPVFVAEHALAAVSAAPILEVPPDHADAPGQPVEETPPPGDALADRASSAGEEDALVLQSITTAHDMAPAPLDAVDPRVDALERWLETIIADRQRRA